MDAVTYEKKLQQAISLSQQATDKDKEGSFQQAFELYKVALDQWNVLCRCQTNAVLREKLYRKMEEYIARAETLKRFLQKQSEKQLLLLRHPSPPNHLLFSHPSSSSSSCSASLPGTHLVLLSPGSPPILTQQQQTLLTSVEGLSSNSSSIQNALSQSSLGGLGGGVGTAGSGGEGYGSSGSMRASGDGDMSEEERMREKLNSAIVTEKPEVRWTDIAGLEAAKDALQEAIVLPSRFPSLFTGIANSGRNYKVKERRGRVFSCMGPQAQARHS
ncbi:vacuolar sorting atpase [Cystoisospora suis]|uniref:Vacuolar sorting atpase n=1 Tax=Cystoisospora suis TaxID=483139 RepID=A0A2C6KS90_9APIC|nr:vacuolar sorting atpase [Cystoisospora suis]